MTTRNRIVIIVLTLVSLVALYPLARVGLDWFQVYRVFDTESTSTPVRAFDWVVWSDDDGPIEADFVFRSGPAARAGIQSGDMFYMLDGKQYFTASNLRRAIDGVSPGETLEYAVRNDLSNYEVDVSVTRYPSFLYPLSGTLWQFSLWGFTVGAFIHLLGLAIAIPLAFRSRQSRTAFVLIGLSAIWIIGNLTRLLAIEIFGPPSYGTGYDTLFQIITIVSLFGWIFFPAVLVRKVLHEIPDLPHRFHLMAHVVYLPAIVLSAVALAVVFGFAPLSLDALVSPILFYASCFIGLASLVMLYARFSWTDNEIEDFRRWGVVGSVLTLLVAIFFALAILDIVPIFGEVTEVLEGWFVVVAQLLSIAPVVLVSVATLRYGKVSHVVTRGIAYILTLGLIFFAFVGILSLIENRISDLSISPRIVAGLLVVSLLVVAERVYKYFHRYAGELFTTDRQRSIRMLAEFQPVVRNELDLQSLIQKTVSIAGNAFGARSAVLFIEDDVHPNVWVKSSFHAEPPYLTERTVDSIWPELRDDGRLWAYRSELNESEVSRKVAESLIQRKAAIAVPITGDDRPIGLLVLGKKMEKRSVYNLEDIDRIRTMANQLGLGIERLRLIERQTHLMKETTEAQLIALRAQINPHFLFNALNTIVALIAEKPADAEDAVQNLSSIFRYVLQTGSSPFVKLSEELGLVRHYLEIEQSRFGNKLEVIWDLDDTSSDHPVPAFSVQTLVENAVKHGIEKKREGGSVTITASRTPGEVTVTVSDTGVGMSEAVMSENGKADDYFGIGLRNVSSRMEQLYKEVGLLEIASVPGEGTTVTLRFPGIDGRSTDGDTKTA